MSILNGAVEFVDTANEVIKNTILHALKGLVQA